MITDAAILIATALAGGILWLPRLRRRPAWQAMTTPLASIIGSGFLVLGPVLAVSFGWLAPVVMAGLCALAWAFGSAVRYNIRVIAEEAPHEDSGMGEDDEDEAEGAGAGDGADGGDAPDDEAAAARTASVATSVPAPDIPHPPAAAAWGGARHPLGQTPGRPRRERWTERLSGAALAFAYMISVAYYLNLFGAFGLSLTPFDTRFADRALTSAVLVLILVVGWVWGFRMLERMEYVSVSVKLAIIAGLVVGLAAYFSGGVVHGRLVVLPITVHGLDAVLLAVGLIVTVQGFETSRYLGRVYPPDVRVRSMRWAQILATVVYLAYIGLTAYIFKPGDLELKETAIVDMMGVVSAILPAMLVAAALAAQFSAAVADTGGSGGLIRELTGGRVSARQGYAALVGVGLVLTWSFDVFHIISYASRAFALYYGLQAGIAASAAWRRGDRARAGLYVALALVGLVIVLFGRSVEGS